MRSKFNFSIPSACRPFGEAVCAGAVLLMASSAPAQNLFVSDYSGNIYEYTPGGAQSTFASRLSNPLGLAFNGAGDLFEADNGSGNIYEFTPGGAQSTFASGLSYPLGLAFNSSGDLFVADAGSGNIYEFTPGGVKSTFASGLLPPDLPGGRAFNSSGDLLVAPRGGNIYEYTPSGARSTFASGLGLVGPIGLAGPLGLAFQGETLPVPEPSSLGLLAVGVTALLARRCRKERSS